MPHATQGAPSDVLAREAEVERVRDALGRRGGRGALLVGAPGAGRSAVIREFAAKAAMPVVRLPHAELVAAMRGPHAERFRALGEELSRARGEVVLALDPVAPWLSPRDTPEDIVLELRAQLASNAVPWVGVATPEEARRLAEAEPWMDRAVVRVDLDELPPAAMREAVTAHARALGRHHGVEVSDEVALRALELSDRYLGGRAQPDRAINVVDLAASRARRQGAGALSPQVLASVVAELGGVPLPRVACTDGERLVALESHIAGRIVGHRDVIARVSHVIRRNAVGFRGPRPIGTFLFLGPTGVGKTETAKAVAEVLFPGAGSLVRLDMAEFSEAHAVARLVGAPPGYVGYGDGGQLSEAVRRKPWCVVLLDEIEKAHRDVLEALLGVLDEGRLTDGRGRTTDFRNTVIVMTSNLGAETFAETSRAIGFHRDGDARASAAAKALAQARGAMPPELWNRIDEPVVFSPLSRAEVAEVAARMLGDAAARLEAEQGVALSWDDGVIDALLDGGGYEPSLGARPMRRALARMVESPVAEAVLRGAVRRGETATLFARDGAVDVRAPARKP
ncbi:MAG: AAA family ATPase [Polyangiales bacterium]